MSSMMLMLVAGLGIELLLLLLVLLTVAYFRSRAQRRRDQQAVKALIARVKKSKPEREKVIVDFLEQHMGLTGDALAQHKVAMLRAELSLLQRFAGVYRQREAAMAARFDDELAAAIAPYHALNGTSGGDAAVPSAADNGELERLRADNKRLSDELSITMETMSRMLNEYSTMFAGNNVDDAAPIAAAGSAAISDTDTDEPLASAPSADESADLEVAILGEDAADGSADEPEAAMDAAEDGAIEQAGDIDAADEADDDDDLVVLSAEEPDPAPVADVPEDDEIAEIMRAAQAQEEIARSATDSASIESGAVDGAGFEEGPSEVLGFDEAAEEETEAVPTDIDDLFDSAESISDNDTDDVDEVLRQAAEAEEGSEKDVATTVR